MWRPASFRRSCAARHLQNAPPTMTFAHRGREALLERYRGGNDQSGESVQGFPPDGN